MRALLVTFTMAGIFLISLASNAASFDCDRVKKWPNYGGNYNGWAVKYCEKLLTGSARELKHTFEDLEKYRLHRSIEQGEAVANFSKLVDELEIVLKKNELNVKDWTMPVRDLHKKVVSTLKYNPQMCATPWECTNIFFGTTDEATLCGDSCNQNEFRLTLENLIPLLDVVITGMETKGTSKELVSFREQLSVIKADKENADVTDIANKKRINDYFENEVRPAVSLLLEEYDRVFASTPINKLP